MRSLLLSTTLLLSTALLAQDTIQVQTLTFSDITKRRGWYMFPDSTHQYRKVLMHHTLKCDPATTADQYPCGEWDYLTYNFIHEHTGAYDSTALSAPLFKVGRLTPASVGSSTVPGFDTWLEAAPTRAIIAVQGEADHALGTADAPDPGTLNAVRGTVRSQYLYTAAELTNSGLVAGLPLDRLRLQVLTGGGIDRVIVRLKNTTATALTTFDEVGLTEVCHSSGALFASAGTVTLELLPLFTWDGTSNVLVDIAADQWTGATAPVLQGSTAAPGLAVQQAGRDGHVVVDEDVIALDPAPLATLTTEVTVMFRAKGGDQLPLNTTVFEARNAQNTRVLNIHLPWSNGSVYWDAGNTGGSYDRINKAATAAEYQGSWCHWAFTKNTATGSMKIYRNGVLWHSGTGLTRPLNGIVRANLGCDADRNNPWPGSLDDVVVLGTELDAATIAAWAGREIDATHPAWADVLYAFSFDETTDAPHRADNLADAAHNAWLLGTTQRAYVRPQQLARAEVAAPVRPDLTFTQGSYTDQVDTLLMPWPAPMPGLAIEHFQVVGNAAQPFDTLFTYADGWSYTHAPDGALVDSTLLSGPVHVNDTLNYFSAPFEVVRNWEIGRFITPYGIGLNLGTSGFRWTFDVTDYQHLLRDSVELSAGNNQELIDLRFELIEGTAPRTVVEHQRPWGPMSSRSYGALSDNTALTPVTVDLSPSATQWALRSRLTGHGHNSNNGEYPHCCEWKDNTHYLHANGTQVDQWHVWQENDCALNPVYPQGGTWPGSREGWCPGDVVKDHVTELTPSVTGDSLVLDYSITPVPTNNQGMAGGNYVVNMDLFGYGAAAHALDAEVYHVKRPTDVAYHRRENPICIDPVVVLRNAGAQDLTSTTFTYGVSGGNAVTHTWTGLLKHMEQVEVTLPVPDGSFWIGDNDHRFTVSVSAPNGGSDMYAANDSYTTHFELPVMYTDGFIVRIQTNNRPWENTVTLRDITGNVVYSRSNMSANTVYEDTVDLWDGCYKLEVMDTGNDGLSYWADAAQGNGTFRLKRMNGSTLKNFQAEFGRTIHWPFTVNGFVGVQEAKAEHRVTAFPNPTTGLVRLHVEGLEGPGLVEVLDALGRVELTRPVELTGANDIDLDLSGAASGLHHIRVQCEGATATLRVVRQ